VRRISHVPALLRSRVLAFEVGERHVHGVVTKRRIRMDSLTQPEPASGRLTIQEPSLPATSEPDANVRKVMQADRFHEVRRLQRTQGIYLRASEDHRDGLPLATLTRPFGAAAIPEYSTYRRFTQVLEPSGSATHTIAGIVSTMSRSSCSARFRSSLSRFTPIQYRMAPSLARRGSTRLRNHRYPPPALRTRKLTSPAQPVRRQSDQTLRVSSRSSGCRRGRWESQSAPVPMPNRRG
jgi:hypothetical protein